MKQLIRPVALLGMFLLSAPFLAIAPAGAVNAPPVNAGFVPNIGYFAPNVKYAFRANYSDANGASDLRHAFLMLNLTVSGANSIYLYYDLPQNKLYMRNDANTAWIGGYAPGSNTVIQNNRARLWCGEVLTSKVGNNFSIRWILSFFDSVQGQTLRPWLFVRDLSGATDGWDSFGGFLVTRPPQNISLAPASGTFYTDTAYSLTTQYWDEAGTDSLTKCILLINDTVSGANSIYLLYDPKTNRLFLRNDANTAWIGNYAPGANATIENSRVRLNVAATKVQKLPATLTLTWNISFKESTSGQRPVAWMYVDNDRGQTSGFQPMGRLNIVGKPSNVSLNPDASFLALKATNTLQARYSDPAGTGAMTYNFLLLNTSLKYENGILVMYDQKNNKFYLRNDANTDWMGGVAPGTNLTLQNNLVTIYVSQVTVTKGATQLQLDVPMVFKNTMNNKTMNVWMRVTDDRSLTSPWDQMRTYTVVDIEAPPPPPPG